jgi:ataxia telangiectasia mutated family protein
MEQVFEMTNRILSRDRKTKARDLRFRRYTVIPLPNRSGVMEFVGDSQAIGEYLKPAHTKSVPICSSHDFTDGRYRADIDHPPDHLRKRLEELQVKDHTSPELTKRYTELMKKFKPVMRHYFTDKHREPMAWFSMRLNYTRSVAVTSIVGHILGIGDRHCSNILIDKQTGELVHIDFGIVFEDVSPSI